MNKIQTMIKMAKTKVFIFGTNRKMRIDKREIHKVHLKTVTFNKKTGVVAYFSSVKDQQCLVCL